MTKDDHNSENRASTGGLTQDEKELLVHRHRERCEFRQALANHALAQTVQLGAALRQLERR